MQTNHPTPHSHTPQPLPKNFRPMRAGKLTDDTDIHNLFNSLRPYQTPQAPANPTTYTATPKLDGIRLLIHPNPKICACTRSIKPIRNAALREYFQYLAHCIPALSGVDGEITAGPPFQAAAPGNFQRTTTAVMAEATEHPTQNTYWVFDRFYHPEVGADYSNLPYHQRYSELAPFIKQIAEFEDAYTAKYKRLPPAHLRLLENVPLYDSRTLASVEESYLAAGFEGVMIRHSQRPYKFGQSAVTPAQRHLLKLKRFEDAEAIITGFEELMHNDNEDTKDNFGLAKRASNKANLRPADTLGALTVQALNGEFEGVSFSIGTGFDQALRQEIWHNQANYLGRIVNFNYQAIGSKDAPRFPTFKAFRED